MIDRAPDFFLGSTEQRDTLAVVRAAWRREPLQGPDNAEFLWVRVEPPVLGQAFGLGAVDVSDLILSPHYAGDTLSPVSGFPLSIYIYRARVDRVFVARQFGWPEVEMVGWGEVYRTAAAAASASAAQ